MGFLKKGITELPYDPAIPLVGVCPEEQKAGVRSLHTCAHSSITDNSQKVEATQTPLDR